MSSTLSLPAPTFPHTLSPIPTTSSDSQTSTSTNAMSVPLPASVLPTVTSSGTTLPSPVPGFEWSDPLSTINTCTPVTFKWEYSGSQETLQFVLVFNASLHTGAAIRRKRAGQSTILATNVDSNALSWTWSKVNTTAGQYMVQASGTDVNAVTSAPFLIINGADTSCLATEGPATEVSTTTRATSAIPSPESSFTPIPATSAGSTAKIGAIGGGTAAGVVVLIIALLGYRVWRRRRRQHPPWFRSPTATTHSDFPSLHVACGTEAPPLTEKGTEGANPLDNIAASSPLLPNHRPPSSLLSEPHTLVPPYTSPTRTHERAAGPLMDVSTIGSRSSAALSDATSTTGLMRTLSSCPPSYLTSPSPPPSYTTHTARGATTPRSPHLSYASSS